jgi:hypothetical protein
VLRVLDTKDDYSPLRIRHSAQSLSHLNWSRCGTESVARCPGGARAYSAVKAMLDPHSSKKTSRLTSSCLICSRHLARSSWRRSVAPNDFFFASSPSFEWHGSWSWG